MKKIKVKGVIVSSDIAWIYRLFGIESTSPADVEQAIEDAAGDDLEVHINSGGGEVFAGAEIYTTLKDYAGNVTVKIVGLAASAASVIAMAGNKVMMSPTGNLMIHNSSTIVRGDHRELQHESEVLQNVDKTIANAYRLKSGMSEDELLSLMAEETWLSPQTAKEKGFIDEIMFDQEQKLAASFGNAQMLPQQVIDTVRNGLFYPKEKRNWLEIGGEIAGVSTGTTTGAAEKPQNSTEEEQDPTPTQASILLKKLDLIAKEA